MADLSDNGDLDTAATRDPEAIDWRREELWWRENYTTRPYVAADRGFAYYAGALRYGVDSALRHLERGWNDVEAELRDGWDRWPYRAGADWDDIREAVRDAWDHVKGREHAAHWHHDRAGDRAHG